MMKIRFRTGPVLGAVGVLCLVFALKADLSRVEAGDTSEDAKPKATPKTEDDKRVPVTTARDRAKLLHDVYSATLDSMHHHFFRRDRAVLPARAMEDVFATLDRQSKIKTRWIAVNTPAMSVDHEPETEFEKKAAKEIAAGKADYEAVVNGYYQRAGAIPLGASCIGCHTKFGSTDNKTPRFAGLVISIPVTRE